MKRATFVLLTFALVSALTACGLGDSPEKAAQEWIQAFANLDGNKIADRTCAAQQTNVQQAGLWSSVFNLFGQRTIGQQAKTDVSGLKFTTVSSSGNTANVRVTGQIRVAVLALSQTQVVDETWRMVQEGGKWKWCGQAGTTVVPPPQLPPAQVTQIAPPPQVVPVTPVIPIAPAPSQATTTFSVSANQGWQDTGVQIQRGQQFRIEYLSGQVKDNVTIIPDGNGTNYVCGSAGCCEPLPNARRSSLIGRVGGEIFFVGNGGAFTVNSNGNLLLRINDCDAGLFDNSGSLQVRVTSLSAGTATFEVLANQPWQDTGVQIQRGQQFRIEYLSGQVKDNVTIIPDGNGTNYVCGSAGCCEPLPNARRSSLIGRVGGEIFFVGNGGAFTVNSNGNLLLRINDCDAGLYDNSGSLTVRIVP